MLRFRPGRPEPALNTENDPRNIFNTPFIPLLRIKRGECGRG
jgi:hypothetical protein